MKKLRDRKDARRVDVPMLMQCCIDLKPNVMRTKYILIKILM